MNNNVYVVGTGPGNPEYLTEYAKKIINNSGTVIVSDRYKDMFQNHKNIIILKDIPHITDTIKNNIVHGDVAVAVTGDTGIYSLMSYLKRIMKDIEFKAVPGISSLQYLMSKAKETWDDAAILTGHGRDISRAKLLGTIRSNRKTVFFCDAEKNPCWICEMINKSALSQLSTIKIYIGEHLSYENEKISIGQSKELVNKKYDTLSLALIINEDFIPKRNDRPKDSEFIRTNVPMTREEVRSVVTDKLNLKDESVIWDIGAGTGSISVTCALQSHLGAVYAIEKKHEACELIKRNIKKFKLCNVILKEGNAIEILPFLPTPTHIFIGGSGSELPEILQYITKLQGSIKVVVTGVTLNTISETYMTLSKKPYCDFDATQIGISKAKKVASNYIMTAQNTITIMSATIRNGEGKQ